MRSWIRMALAAALGACAFTGPAVGESLAALAASLPADDGHIRSAIFFGIPAEGLVPGPLSARARLLRAAGPSAPIDAFEVTVTLESGDLEGRRQVQIFGDLLAPPGDYRLALEITGGEVTAQATYPLTLSPPRPGQPRVLPPMLLDDEGFVAAFYERGTEEDPRNPPSDYPFLATGEPIVPVISPRLDDEVPRSRICLIGRALTDEKTFLETGLIAADGSLLSKERLAMVSQDDADANGFETLCLGLDTQGLPVGLYQLNVTLHDFERRGTERTELSFEISEAGK